MKIAILGFSGSGKSTLATKLGEIYSVPVLHLDSVFFKESWEERDKDEALEIVESFMKKTDWIIEGNYTGLYQKDRLNDADRIIYLNFNRFTCLYRVVKRYFKYRGTTRDDMADGCDEKIDWEFIKWILHEGRNKNTKKHYQEIMEKYNDKAVMCKNQRQVDNYINSL